MKKLFVIVVTAILIMAMVAPVFGAGKLIGLEVQVWPEYDKPSVLIMCAGNVKDAKNITVYFPKGTKINKVLKKVISKNDKGENNNYTEKTQGNNLAVSFPLPNDTFFTEGYWDVLTGQGSDKSFSFDYIVPLDTDEIQLYIQKPLGATNFKVEPKPPGFTKDDNKMELAQYIFKNKKQGEKIPFKVSYTKSNSALSVESLQNKQVKTAAGAGSADTKTVLSVILALAFFVVGGYTLYAYKQSGVNLASKPKIKQNMQTQKFSNVINYCPNCGSKAHGKFCSQCGQSLK